MNEEDIKETDLKDLRKGLSSSGKFRSAMLTGPQNGKVSECVIELGNFMLQESPESFWINIDSAKSKTPYDWCSQFARNLRTNKGVPLADLAKFALNTGKSLSPFKSSSGSDESRTSDDNTKVAKELVLNFENLIKDNPALSGPPHLILAVNNLGDYDDRMIRWLSDCLNPAIRKSKAFKSCRFLFTSEKITDRLLSFFDSFGFEKIHTLEVEPLPPTNVAKETTQPDSVLSEPVTADTVSSDPTKQKSPKPLKKNALPSKLKEVSIELMDVKDAERLLSPFKNEEKEYLFLASYPTRVSKYSLEHFATDREAALSYNWLKRTKSLCTIHQSGDLLLNDDIRVAARTVHAAQNEECSNKWGTLASVFDTFQDNFPTNETHWVPVNLQLLESFDHKILRLLFDEDDLQDIDNFLEQHKNLLIEKGNKIALPDESKLIIRRYLELSERTCIPGLEDKIRDIWLKDQDEYKRKRAKMLDEKNNITSDIEGTLNQVASIKELKENLEKDFRNPKKNKADKTYSFSTSRALIVIGLVTIGISLLADSIGSYHAACGLALTLFGFFWPNVEVKRTAFATEGPKSSLAIETQHRSLNHRVGSLSNRIQVMKGNLDAVEKQLSDLGDSPPLPYLEQESED